jgi:hypothetical protein
MSGKPFDIEHWQLGTLGNFPDVEGEQVGGGDETLLQRG